jgi:hypothetical protein
LEQVRGLRADDLATLIENVGLEDAGEILAFTDARQLGALFEYDLWKAEVPGGDEAFDATRFVTWLEVLLEAGERWAAEQLANCDAEFSRFAFSRLVWVVEQSSLRTWVTNDDDGELLDKALESSLSQDMGDWVVMARVESGWDAVLAVLLALDEQHGQFLEQLLSGIARAQRSELEDGGSLYDALNDMEVLQEDASALREENRARRGFISPAEARAFLRLARGHVPLRPEEDPISRAYFRRLEKEEAVVPRNELGRWIEKLQRSEKPPELETRAAESPGFLRGWLRRLSAEARESQLEQLAFLTNVLVAGDERSERWRPAEASQEALCIAEQGVSKLRLETPPAALAALLEGWGLIGLFRLGSADA